MTERLENFLANPTANGCSHAAYKDSLFSIKPAPETATGEIMLASLYRAIGFKNLKEGQIGSNANKLSKLVNKNVPEKLKKEMERFLCKAGNK